MGAKLTKNKSVSILGKAKEEKTATVENMDNQLDLTTTTTIENDEQSEKKNKKKKEPKSKKKSSPDTLDKGTNTENSMLPSSTFNEQLVGDQISTVSNTVSLDTNITQVNTSYQTEVPLLDGQELRNACIHNGIISMDSQVENKQTSNEQDDRENNLTTTAESSANTSVACAGITNQVYTEEQQQSVE
ncbi:unnamed protein product [Rotaria magnacalcarata]|uniref:Uncharacterized protein n=1 Tax=Rotaria magnacalcarata TaxID=392030 RepID=A0A816QU74_9BILA|nr:unnamed protein product [Rotaria magnacalcarata]CAF2177318.1 unnamed protein product [Rotaria magnacalcarata]CAF3777264.1 unnamed protein product [Rotaria magnacalcarata]CAF3823659.1 unnamed protein product [Rotaria magnacalcarata]